MLRSVFTGALAGAAVAVCCAAPAVAEISGYVDRAEWASYDDGLSLRVYPSASARAAALRLDAAAGEQAWREVLQHAPEADRPGMREQFLCHWNYAEFARPGKLSWNLEPWRPVVDWVTMLESGCNPGAAEEVF
ncbi:DUF2599 domain-containing protein [Mycolicibacter hiberniae]|uniref:DUF2599 domain-containing protein n=1 Tax=Mycolicibacter hiberniae TaxID=29314 RepID=A0A7I7X7N9_9MYCO|nr:DUF2599 domain-containing protein [Mycolicibacter hiberniae]MCV7087222.1 DUF2599 domain-containing protein [Mycolicibacter hiberniae]BBZ25564.1 hypothetical protein MHIB_39820 [Mycolicibacter hiberniae]